MKKYYQKILQKSSVALVFVLIFSLAVPALAKVPNDPDYAMQTSLWNQINAPTAWNYSIGSRRVVVAIIDSGADIWHEDLHMNIWTNPNEIAGNGIDDDHNGYIDDIHGWNFVDNNNNVRPSVASSTDGDAGSVDHGTLLAGLVGAAGDNGLDGVGLNWRISIMPLRAIDNDGSGSYANVAKAVNYAIDNGANVISMSFVGPADDPELRASLLRAYRKGIVVVAAAGNHDSQVTGDLNERSQFPACFTDNSLGASQWMLTVGSVDATGEISSFSNYGRCVSLVAPGEYIYETERYAPQYGYSAPFGGPWQGTSFSAPLVAGAAALIKAMHPSWGAAQIIPILLSTAGSIASHNPSFSANDWGAGLLDAGRALAKAAEIDPSIPIEGSILSHSTHGAYLINLLNGSEHQLAKVNDASIISTAITPWPGYGLSEATSLLLRRGNYFYVRIVSDSGLFIKEFALPVQANAATQIWRLRLYPNSAQEFGLPVVEEYDTKKNETTLSEFDTAGTLLFHDTVKGAIFDWGIDTKANAFIVAQLQNRQLTLEEIPLDGGTPLFFHYDGVTTISGFAVGSFLNGFSESDQVAVVLRAPGAEQLIVDIPSGSYRRRELPSSSANNPWLLTTVQPSGLEGQAFLRYPARGGKAEVSSGRDDIFETLNVPTIKGTID